MGLFTTKKSRRSSNRVPDLSRYSNQQPSAPQSYGNSHYNSNMAAASALRTYSLNSQSYVPTVTNRQPNRYSGAGRTMSLSSYRSDSLSSLNSRGRLTRGSVRPEKIVIKRTETKDEYGRTTSITTETIRTLGSYDLVKRETEDVLQPPPQVYQTSGENELDSILEEDESTDSGESRTRRSKKSSQRNMSPVRSILKSGDGTRPSNKEKKVILVGDDDEISDGGSIYSDAYDILPSKMKSTPKAMSKPALKQTAPSKPASKQIAKPHAKLMNPSRRSTTQSGMSQSIKKPERGQQHQEQPQQQLDQQQMYDIAYKVALEKVYGGEREIPGPPKTGGFKSYSLRGENPMSKKSSVSSQKLNLSRTNSISSLTQRFLPLKSSKKEKGEVETHRSEHSFEGFESTNVQNLASPERVTTIESIQSKGSQQRDVGTNAALTSAALSVDTSTRETNTDSFQSRRTDAVSENAGQSHEVLENKSTKKQKKKSIALATLQKAFGHPGLKHMYPELTETNATKQEEAVEAQEPVHNTTREAVVENYAPSQEPAEQEIFPPVEVQAHDIQDAVESQNSSEEEEEVEEEEEEQKEASSSTQQSHTREQTGFTLHTMRDVIHKESKPTEAPKNYNTQLHGHFETLDIPSAKDDRTDGSTLMAENGINESDIHEHNNSVPVDDTLKNSIGQSHYTTQPTNTAESTTTKPHAAKEKKKLTFKRLISFKF